MPIINEPVTLSDGITIRPSKIGLGYHSGSWNPQAKKFIANVSKRPLLPIDPRLEKIQPNTPNAVQLGWFNDGREAAYAAEYFRRNISEILHKFFKKIERNEISPRTQIFAALPEMLNFPADLYDLPKAKRGDMPEEPETSDSELWNRRKQEVAEAGAGMANKINQPKVLSDGIVIYPSTSTNVGYKGASYVTGSKSTVAGMSKSALSELDPRILTIQPNPSDGFIIGSSRDPREAAYISSYVSTHPAKALRLFLGQVLNPYGERISGQGMYTAIKNSITFPSDLYDLPMVNWDGIDTPEEIGKRGSHPNHTTHNAGEAGVFDPPETKEEILIKMYKAQVRNAAEDIWSQMLQGNKDMQVAFSKVPQESRSDLTSEIIDSIVDGNSKPIDILNILKDWEGLRESRLALRRIKFLSGL